MTLIEAVLLTIKNSQWPSSTRTYLVVAQLRVAQVATTLMTSLRDSEQSLPPEVLEVLLVSASNLELWTTTTADLLISTNLPRP